MLTKNFFVFTTFNVVLICCVKCYSNPTRISSYICENNSTMLFYT